MLEADLIEDAGRAAYLAAFHAAQALIYERENRSLKTHGGVQSEFSKLIRDDPSVPTGPTPFLVTRLRIQDHCGLRPPDKRAAHQGGCAGCHRNGRPIRRGSRATRRTANGDVGHVR
jgi:hypothetical protein